MMHLNLDIDDQLIQEAMQLTRFKTQKAMIETGLKLLIRIRRQEQIEGRTQICKWDDGFDNDIVD